MLSPRLRGQIFDLWTALWSSGMTNPLTSIEQITYLLFLKYLEGLDINRLRAGKPSIYRKRPDCHLDHNPAEATYIDLKVQGSTIVVNKECPGHNTCRWSYIISLIEAHPKSIRPHEHLSQFVFPWLRVLDETLYLLGSGQNEQRSANAPMEDAYFQFPKEKPSTLRLAFKTIDDLFNLDDVKSINADIMGDIFEYLLNEIQTSGKNGQFRTPRHIIRFMVELLDPKLGEKIADPAAGTGGFLINSIQHIWMKNTSPEDLILEWDGTPHNIHGNNITDSEKYFTGTYFTGYDNDRTMVRIGWMNMILHGIERPNYQLKDTLGKSFASEESLAYKKLFANPPFRGTVDKNDLHEDRFLRKVRSGQEAITNSSELLFVWLLLDMLEKDGKAAVIVPDNVLFGTTDAHRELRRQLVLENKLRAVISLPGGVFLPYTGVKTAILVFEKKKELSAPGKEACTEKVWFYEVTADGYTFDAKRSEKPTPNDFWDALAKWPEQIVDCKDYFQPKFETVRLRYVDDTTLKIFPYLSKEQGKVKAIHDLFKELDHSPDIATQQIQKKQRPLINSLFQRYLDECEMKLLSSRTFRNNKGAFNAELQQLYLLFDNAKGELLEKPFDKYKDATSFGREALDILLKDVHTIVEEKILEKVTRLTQSISQPGTLFAPLNTDELNPKLGTTFDWKTEVESIVIEFAKLDGYNARLRSLNVLKQEDELFESKSWFVPVRIFKLNEDWRSQDGKLKGSHTENGSVRNEYIADINIYNKEGTIKEQFLEANCIEANDFILTAERYKPLFIAPNAHRLPGLITRELQELNQQYNKGLADLVKTLEEWG